MTSFYTVRPKASIGISTSKIVKVVEPLVIMKGASLAARIAHDGMSPDQCAKGAARCSLGAALVLPTMTTLCEQFGTYYAAVVAARNQLGAYRKEDFWLRMALRGWMNCNDDQKAILASIKEKEFWHALEHAADYQD